MGIPSLDKDKVTMKTLLALLGLVAFGSAGYQNQNARQYKSYFIPQIYKDHGGKYNGAYFCPDGTWASGWRQKTDKGCAGGGECSGLNGIELLCSSSGGNHQVGNAKTEIDVPLGLDVNWRANHWCADGKWLNAAQLLSQPDQGFFADDAGVEGVNFRCDDGSDSFGSGDEVRRTNRDNWLEFSSCPAGTLICGVNAAGEWEMFDNVAFDKVAFFCCDRPATSYTG